MYAYIKTFGLVAETEHCTVASSAVTEGTQCGQLTSWDVVFEKNRLCNSDKRVIWTLLIFHFSLSLSHVSLPTMIHQLKREGVRAVCVTVCGGGGWVGLLGRSLAAVSIQFMKTFCWAYGVGLWAGSTLDNWQFSNIVDYYNMQSI